MPDLRDEVGAILSRHEELKTKRSSFEALWRECERWVDPHQEGGFWQRTPGGQRDAHITDDTATLGLETFVAAMDAMLTPEGEKTTPLTTTDQSLNEDPAMKRWLVKASDRLHACRNAPHTGFAAQSPLRWRMLGLYGGQGFWTDDNIGRGLFYQSVHPSELFVDDDFKGTTDTIHRARCLKARHIAQMFHDDQLPSRVREALANDKPDDQFHLIQVLRPNSKWEPGRIDAGRFPIQSIYMLEEGKELIAAGGYRTMPLSFSRYALSPNSVYGIGPSGKTIGSIKMLNMMERDVVKAQHIGLSPPILMPSDGTINRMEMTPGAPIPGGMENGRRMIEPYMAGVNISYTDKMFERRQMVVNAAFLVHVFAIMNEPIDRQTATEFLGRKREAMLLQAPNVGRQMQEALGPQVSRELDILIHAGQIDPPPPVFHEAGAGVAVKFDNPLTRAAQAADAQNFMSGLQMLEPVAQVDPSVFDVIDTDAAPRGIMESLGVRADWMATPDQVAAKRKQRQSNQEAAQLADAAPGATQAMLNMAKARQLSGAA
ncbi:portal protein [Novosphingobium rosa]|uniref:portal protein n=1 Tax=Novosphingobium rosa TaxID=76978 RepID=UPI0008313448|nr:portal protein [Novosphingobium rosa]